MRLAGLLAAAPQAQGVGGSWSWRALLSLANPMATAAAIDRIVHHSAILEFDVPSYRTGAAQKRLQQEVNRQK